MKEELVPADHGVPPPVTTWDTAAEPCEGVRLQTSSCVGAFRVCGRGLSSVQKRIKTNRLLLSLSRNTNRKLCVDNADANAGDANMLTH